MIYQDILQGLKDKNIRLALPTHLWDIINPSIKTIIQTGNWTTFKYYINSQKNNVSISKINNHTGGIYIFFVSPEVIPQNHRIIMYVGKAEYTNTQNLRKRIREYYGYAPPDHQRPKISNMLSEWGDYLYCSYLELNCSNQDIADIETELINTFLFPCNDKIPNVNIAGAVKAAGLQ